MKSSRVCRYLPASFLVLGWVTNLMRLLTAPPGVQGDTSRCAIYTWDFLREGLWPFYVYHQWAPNPLINYIQAPVFLIFGFTRAAQRGVTAVASAIAVPLVFIACRELFRERGERFSRQAGIVAALGLALSPFVTQLFHHGTEGALLPAVELTVVAFLWRGVRRGRWTDFGIAGLFMGLSQYTYITARVFPIGIALGCLAALISERAWLRRWWGLALTAVTAALVALPQWLLFLQYPYTFTARMQQTSGQFIFNLPDAGAIFREKLLNQLLMLGVRWNTEMYNPYSGRPLLTPLLFAGVLLAFVAVARRRAAGARFTLALTLVMLVPDLLAYEGVIPSATRLSGTYPWLFAWAGLGCAELWSWWEQRPGRIGRAAVVVPVLVLAAGLESQWDFAVRVLPQVYRMPGLEWQTSLVELAEADYIHAHSSEKILLTASEYQRAPLTFLLAEDYPERVSGVPLPLKPGEAVRVVAPVEPERGTTEGIPAGYVPDEWVLLAGGKAYWMPPVPGGVEPIGVAGVLTAANGVAAATTYPGRWVGTEPGYTPLDLTFENGLQLVGYRTSEFKPGALLEVTLYWKATRPIAEDVEFFTQVLDGADQYLVGIHAWPLHGAYRVRAWDPGAVMPVSYRLALPPELGAGSYRLTTGVFHMIARSRVPLVSGGDMATVKIFEITR